LYEIEVVGEERLTSEVVTIAVEKQTRFVCIGALPPNGLVKSRYLCKRLRGVSPKPKIVVGRWRSTEDEDEIRNSLISDGGDQVDTNNHSCARLEAASGFKPLHRSKKPKNTK
jgi:hypothetical protein